MGVATPVLPPVVVVQHVAPETSGAIGRAIEARGYELRVVRAHLGDEVPRRLGEAAGLVVMGGPMGVYESGRYAHLRSELALIEDALAVGAPILGVCLGSQLLAAALRASVHRAPRAEIGWAPIEWLAAAARDPVFAPIVGSGLTALHWHGDMFELPLGAVPLARSALTAHQVFAYEQRAYGLLCHLEVTQAIVAGMVDAFADEARAAGSDPTQIGRDGARYLPALTGVAPALFGRWARLLDGRARGVPGATRRPDAGRLSWGTRSTPRHAIGVL